MFKGLNSVFTGAGSRHLQTNVEDMDESKSQKHVKFIELACFAVSSQRLCNSIRSGVPGDLSNH